jgi:hypothetical protein
MSQSVRIFACKFFRKSGDSLIFYCNTPHAKSENTLDSVSFVQEIRAKAKKIGLFLVGGTPLARFKLF